MDQNVLTSEALEAALEEQRQTGTRLGEILLSQGAISRVDLARGLAAAAGVDFVDLDESKVDPSLARLVPQAFLHRSITVPYGADGDTLLVAMANPGDVFVLDDLRSISGRRVRSAMADESQIREAIERAWGAVSRLDASAADDSIVERSALLLQSSDDDSPAVQLVNDLLSRAVAEHASDVHFEPTRGRLRIRFRVDGIARDVTTIASELQAAIVSRLKIMAHMNIAERRLPQDGRMSLLIGNGTVDARLVTLPTAEGEALVIRLLDTSMMVRSLDELAMLPENQRRFEASVREPQGAILAAGPTGSGKSTTLYATLSALNDPGRTIVTVEDPVEHRMEGIKQIAVNPKINLTFAAALRSILRSDPDVILIGEIRDPETARIAVESALTGHKVLSSLHTNSAAAAPARLGEMGVPPYLITSSLQCIVGQRLVRQLCRCREPFSPTAKELAQAGYPEDFMPAEEMVARFCRKRGCAQCAGTGYRGRMAVHEVLSMSDAIRQLVVEKASPEIIEARAEFEGLVPMRLDGLHKASAGLTTIEEVLRVVPA